MENPRRTAHPSTPLDASSPETAMAPPRPHLPAILTVFLLVLLSVGGAGGVEVLAKSILESCVDDSGAGGRLSCNRKVVVDMAVPSESVSASTPSSTPDIPADSELYACSDFWLLSDGCAGACGPCGVSVFGCRAAGRRRWSCRSRM